MRIIILLLLLIICYSLSNAQLTIIKNVPDYSQPPQKNLPSTIDSNFCAPFAFLNIIAYWEQVQNHPNAQGILGGLAPTQAVEYIGWFMDTNNQGSPSRMNDNGLPLALGTYAIDQLEGIRDYIMFDQNNPLSFPWTIPPGKVAYLWDIQGFAPDIFPEYQREINDGSPVKLDFLYWHILPTGDTLFDPGPPPDTILIYTWGPIEPNTLFDPEVPWEEWNLENGENGIGHAVTGVGYIIDTLEFAIVHDNWRNTPKNIAIPWNNPLSPWPMVSFMIFVHIPPATSIDLQESIQIENYSLRQNYPNPFNASTVINWQLAVGSWVQLSIYDLSGREVAVLVDEHQPAGDHQIAFDAADLASGVYYYYLTAGGYSAVKKMVVIK